MNKKEKKWMLSYMIPREWVWNNEDMGVRSNMFIRIYADLAKHDHFSIVWEDVLEDVIMDNFQYAIKNDKYMTPNYFVRRVKTYYFREINKRNGMTTNGKKYKSPNNHVSMTYINPECLTDGTLGNIDINGNFEKNIGINTSPKHWYKGAESNSFNENE